MKYRFCSIHINVTQYEVTFATKGVLTPVVTPLPNAAFTHAGLTTRY